MKMRAGDNFLTYLRDKEGNPVSESVRRGHNVFTNYGREWLRDLIIWDTIAATDVPLESRRLKRIVYGRGSFPPTTDVVWVNIYTTAYRITAQSVTTFPASTTVRLQHVIPYNSFNGTIFSETGLQLRIGNGSLENKLAFYKTFTPILKTVEFELVTTWELKF